MKKGTCAVVQASRSSVIHDGLHRTGVDSGLTTGDDPPDPGEIEPGKGAEQRLTGDESDCGGHVAQVVGHSASADHGWGATQRPCAVAFALEGDPSEYDSDTQAIALEGSVAPAA
jgi:hypothetical protein